jgi:CRP/FNR family cyclic AMP-dependent transcriptional regulator
VKERDVTKTDVVKMLSEVPLFSELSKKELESLARSAKEVNHKQGAVLAKEGDSGLGFFLIADGTASVSVRGRPRAKMGPGDFFGEISLLDQGPRSATVVAETPVRLIGITQWVFKRLVEQNPALAWKLLRVMATRLRGTRPQLTA